MPTSPAWHRRFTYLGDLGDAAWQWFVTVALAVLAITAAAELGTGLLLALLELAWRLR